jgi:hypothetical protein
MDRALVCRGVFLWSHQMSKPTAKEILTAMGEFFRHNNSVDPYAMFDETTTFKKAVEEYLQQQAKDARKEK